MKNSTNEKNIQNDIIEELKKGNERFLSGETKTERKDKESTEKIIEELKYEQNPKAIILSCSDSRVPPEVIFDQELGDLFVIRNAGHQVDDFVLGSIEFGVKYVKIPVIFVLAHNDCGAIKATIEGKETTSNLDKIINNIKSNNDLSELEKLDKESAARELENKNLLNSILDLEKSDIIKEYIRSGKVKITGGKYSLSTGKVRFLD